MRLLPAIVMGVSLMACSTVVEGSTASLEPAGSPVLDEVVVMGEHTGPGLWQVRHGAAQLWILGSLSPLPKGITWRSRQVEAVLGHTDRVLLQKPVDLGVVRILWLLITEHKLLLAGAGKRLRDEMPADLYARFARQRLEYTSDAEKWEHFRPLVASAFLQQAAFHRVGLSTRLDLGAAVRTLAKKRDVPIEELKVAGVRDLVDVLKTLAPAAENACVAASLVTVEKGLPLLLDRAQAWATGNVELLQRLRLPQEIDDCRAALDTGAGANELIALVRGTWLDAMEKHLQGGGVTLAVVNLDLLLEKGGLLDELRAKGYTVEAP